MSHIHQAGPADAPLVEELLVDTARWADALGGTMWEEDPLD